MAMNTLPVWCMAWGLSVEVARKAIARRPELQKLGVKFGPLKLYSDAEAKQIKAALDARGERKTATVE